MERLKLALIGKPAWAKCEGNGMNIGEAARASGVSAKMIRHYEAIGLLPSSRRSLSGYRLYNDRDVHVLRFIRRARNLGFSLDRIGRLLSLWRDQGRASADVKALAQRHIGELEDKIRQLQEMRDVLSELATSCSGDSRADCPILTGLAEPARMGQPDPNAPAPAEQVDGNPGSADKLQALRCR